MLTNGMEANMQTSDRGVAAIELEESVVLRAYRCPAGRWTIGAGLTAASGVVRPAAGMVISAKEARRLLKLALTRNYEPAVAKAMREAQQHEFDAGVSFHFNTGAIGRASWVKAWRNRNWPVVEVKIKLWNKGGGKVLPGLVRRRVTEFLMLRDGLYPALDAPQRAAPKLARIALNLSGLEIDNIRAAMRGLGYEPGREEVGVLEAAVRQFQRDHDLTVDGIVGRATLSTLQRRIDAKSKTMKAAGSTGAGSGAVAAGATTPAADAQPVADFAGAAGWVIIGVGLIWLAILAWRYRDVIAAKIENRLPDLAAKLRSI